MKPRAILKSMTIVPTMLVASTGGFDVHWDVQSVGFTPTFQLQTSDTEAGPWTTLGSPTSGYSVTGVGPKRLNFQVDLFFQLLVINTAVSPHVTVLTAPPAFAAFAQNRHDFLNYREMIRRENLGMSRYNGQPGVLLRRIVNGTPCPVCRDETLHGPMSNECGTCYGTGWTGGYYTGAPVLADLDEDADSPDNTALSSTGPAEVKPCNSVFPAYPVVKFKDLYVDLATNQRYEVQSSQSDQSRGSNIRQIVVLSRLQPSDPAYQVPTS